MKTFGVSDNTNLTPYSVADGRTDGWTDGRSGPTTRPAFAKATQVRKVLKTAGSLMQVENIAESIFVLLGVTA